MHAQIPELITQKLEVTARATILGGSTPGQALLFTHYNKSTKRCFQHGLSFTSTNNMAEADFCKGTKNYINYSKVPSYYTMSANQSRSLFYSFAVLKNIKLTDKVWMSHGPGLGVSFSSNNYSYISSYQITTIGKDSSYYTNISRANTLINSIGFTLFYSAMLKYAITARWNINIAWQLSAYSTMMKTMETTKRVNWQNSEFKETIINKEPYRSLKIDYSNFPVSSIGLSYMF